MTSSGGGRPAAAGPDPLPLPVVDNHLHLDHAREGEDLPDIAATLAAAARVNVTRVVQIGCDLPGARMTVAAVEAHPTMVGGVALHPNEVPRLAASGELDAAYAEIASLAEHPRVRTIGETGLDYYRTDESGRPVQQDGFRWHLALARRVGKPVQVHDREAHADVLRILAEEPAPPAVVLHCFSGDVEMAREAVARGYYLSFAGPVTFKNARGLRDALAVTPLEQLLVETDAPYLAPSPHRGATNTPALVPYTVRVMADVLAVDVPTLCRALDANAERLYGPW
ncbi:MAG: TatD family hydrolase [Actinomycetales bacterium]|nr:TatD family hydrolase [Candidatus Lutibacillus vidarii]